MATNLTGLRNFYNKIKNFGETRKIANEIVDELAIRGAEIARREYGSVEGVNVYSETTGNGSSRIIAQGEKVAYIEFGTGIVGKNSKYPKKHLPKETLTFESPKGEMQTTSGWEYYYNNPRTKRKVTDEEGNILSQGWWHKFEGEDEATYVTGQEAGKQMYKTSQELRKQAKTIIKNKIRSKDTNV